MERSHLHDSLLELQPTSIRRPLYLKSENSLIWLYLLEFNHYALYSMNVKKEWLKCVGGTQGFCRLSIDMNAVTVMHIFGPMKIHDIIVAIYGNAFDIVIKSLTPFCKGS